MICRHGFVTLWLLVIQHLSFALRLSPFFFFGGCCWWWCCYLSFRLSFLLFSCCSCWMLLDLTHMYVIVHCESVCVSRSPPFFLSRPNLHCSITRTHTLTLPRTHRNMAAAPAKEAKVTRYAWPSLFSLLVPECCCSYSLACFFYFFFFSRVGACVCVSSSSFFLAC